MFILRRNPFVEGEFLVLVVLSVFIAAIIYRALWSQRAVPRSRALFFGLTLIILAGVDMFLLRALTRLARLSPSIFNDVVFDSGLTAALYLLPTLFAGTGINVVSHLVIHPQTLSSDPVRRRAEEPTPSPGLRPNAAEVLARSTHQTPFLQAIISREATGMSSASQDSVSNHFAKSKTSLP